MAHFDVLILGHGLAGSTLAWALRWKGLRVGVIDRHEAGTSSRIAAGLMTPVVGQRLAMSWRFPELYPRAVAFYQRIERETGGSFLSFPRMVRLFRDRQERALFEERAQTHLQGLVDCPNLLLEGASLANEFGGLAMRMGGQLNVASLLDVSLEVLRRSESFFPGEVDPGLDTELTSNGVRLPRLNMEAGRLIFCQGFEAGANPFFPGLPFNCVKGEMLTLRIPGLSPHQVVHRDVWLAPIGDNLFRAGSTYDRDNLNREPTSQGREQILARLGSFLRLPFEVVDHQAGVRPAFLDGRPRLGLDPHRPQLGFFNGLGSKGSVAAP